MVLTDGEPTNLHIAQYVRVHDLLQFPEESSGFGKRGFFPTSVKTWQSFVQSFHNSVVQSDQLG